MFLITDLVITHCQSMYDTIHLKLSLSDIKSEIDFIEVLPNYLDNVGVHYFEGATCISGNLNGLKVTANQFQVKVKDGSLCKYALGDNYQTLTRQQTERAIEQLSDALHLPMAKASVTRLDIAQNIVLKHPTSVYLNHLGQLKNATRLQEPAGLYYSQNGARLCFYDKNKEQSARQNPIPDLYRGKNVLRYEQRYLKRIAPKLGVPEVTGGLLHNEAFYMKLLNRWRDTYKSIQKINDVTLDFKRMTTKKELNQMGVLSLVERAGGQTAMLEQIAEAQKRGDITTKQAFDLRKAINDACQCDGALIVPNEAIKELDKKIMEAIKYYR